MRVSFIWDCLISIEKISSLPQKGICLAPSVLCGEKGTSLLYINLWAISFFLIYVSFMTPLFLVFLKGSVGSNASHIVYISLFGYLRLRITLLSLILSSFLFYQSIVCFNSSPTTWVNLVGAKCSNDNNSLNKADVDFP